MRLARSRALSMTRSTLKLSEAARHLVIPDGITTSVFPRVYRRLRAVGVEFDAWQVGFGTAALGCRANGKYAATVGGVVASIPRQVGKTFTVGNLLVGLCLEFPGLRVVWTSHHNRTTTNTFRSIQGLVRNKRIYPLLDHTTRSDGIRAANGEQEIKFKNGSIIMFGAREQGFGRGIDEIDVEVFDEAQILGIKALEDMVPATNQAKHPHGGLIFFLGTPPRPTDDGEAFTAKRQKALDGKTKDQLYVEFSADPDTAPDDRSQWPIMNPSHPHRTPVEAMLRMRENIPDDDSWNREARGIWPDLAAAREYVLDLDAWSEMQDGAPRPVGARSVAVSRTQNLEWLSVAAATRTSAGRIHVEVGFHGGSSDAVLRLVMSLVERWDPCALVIDSADTAMTLQTPLLDAGVEPDVTTASDYLLACSNFVDFTAGRRLSHTGDPLLQGQIEAAEWRKLLGGLVWQDRTATDVSVLKAASLAVHGLVSFEGRAQRKGATTPKFVPVAHERNELDLMTAGF